MTRSGCLLWWQGFPCEIQMLEDRYTIVFYAENGPASVVEFMKSDICDVGLERRRVYAGMEPYTSYASAALWTAIAGPVAGFADMIAKTKERPSFKNKPFFIMECTDGGILEFEFDWSRDYNGGLFRQGVNTFVSDFKRHRYRYATSRNEEAIPCGFDQC